MAPNASVPVSAQSKRPGDDLRKIRGKRGISARHVEALSRAIALEQGNEEFTISHGRIIQVENNESTPSIYKLCSLSAIYGMSFTEMARLFVDMDRLSSYRHNLKRGETCMMKIEAEHSPAPASVPACFNPAFDIDRTGLLSRMVQVWGEMPVTLLQQLNLRSFQYGIVGLNDFTMYPLLKPGSFVQVDDTQRKVVNVAAANEYERPIYFIELRSGYLCGWCEIQNGRLMVIPHPLSPCKIQTFAYPNEAEILGRVVAIAARIAPIKERQASTAGAPASA